jgi:hypothetical protein
MMRTTFRKKDQGGKGAEKPAVYAATILEMDVQDSPVSKWFSNISQNDTASSDKSSITVIDRGNSIEFILPKKTAQFTEMTVLDTRGKVVWKTQTLNEHIIVWPKQTAVGKKVPCGRYVFQMRQGDRKADGVAMIA